jgi:hypothetical protein
MPVPSRVMTWSHLGGGSKSNAYRVQILEYLREPANRTREPVHLVYEEKLVGPEPCLGKRPLEVGSVEGLPLC